MEKNAKLTAIKHADVYGKELLYLKIETESGTVMVNIGEKTYKNVKAITETKQTELPLTEKPKK